MTRATTRRQFLEQSTQTAAILAATASLGGVHAFAEARPEVIRLGFPFQDRNARLLVTDIERQMKWWTDNGFMKRTVALKGIVDTSFVEEAVKAFPEK